MTLPGGAPNHHRARGAGDPESTTLS